MATTESDKSPERGSPGAPAASPSASPLGLEVATQFCALCETGEAQWHCAQCELFFCDGCNETTHLAGAADQATKYHTVIPVGLKAQHKQPKKKKSMRRMSVTGGMNLIKGRGRSSSSSSIGGGGGLGTPSPRPEIDAMDRNVKLAEPAAIWLNGIGTVSGTVKFMVDSITDPASGRLKFVPAPDETGSTDLGRALIAAWCASTPSKKSSTARTGSSLGGGGGGPAMAADVFYALNTVVYQCLETAPDEPAPEPEPEPESEPEAASGSLDATSSASGSVVTLAASSSEVRRPIETGENMLHMVLLDDGWDRSLTLRFFMGDEIAARCGELIDEAVQADVAKGNRSKRKMRLTKWLMHRKDFVRAPHADAPFAGGGGAGVPFARRFCAAACLLHVCHQPFAVIVSEYRVLLPLAFAPRSSFCSQVPPEDASIRAGMNFAEDSGDSLVADTSAASKASKFAFGRTQMQRSGGEGGQAEGAEDGADDELDDALSAEIIGPVVAESKVLTKQSATTLHKILPLYQQVNSWELLYGSTVHGISLNTFYRRCQGRGATLLVVEDLNGNVFGGYASAAWKGPADNFYGTGESFLWAFKAGAIDAWLPG
eukprot:SAG22_NODE_20_length_32168_cov_40.859241_11_plen_601_part_00